MDWGWLSGRLLAWRACALFPFPAPQETKSPCSEDDSSRGSGTTQSMYRVRKCWQVVQVAKDYAVTGLGFKLCFVEEES